MLDMNFEGKHHTLMNDKDKKIPTKTLPVSWYRIKSWASPNSYKQGNGFQFIKVKFKLQKLDKKCLKHYH